MTTKIKGIILAGGSGTRLYPLTKVTNKHLLPVYDKPMIYYPLTTLMLGGIKEILIITNPHQTNSFAELLGDGSQWGISIEYAEQENPNGIAECFLIGEKFLGNNPCCLILGDNIFYSNQLSKILLDSKERLLHEGGAIIFGSHVKDPREYGVVQFDEEGKILSLEEKPEFPKSNWAIPGIYFYDSNVTEYAKTLSHSDRGELEITDINRIYQEKGTLKLELLGRGSAWFDAGSPAKLIQASLFVQTIQDRQNLKICCPDEVACHNGWIEGNIFENWRSFAHAQNF